MPGRLVLLPFVSYIFGSTSGKWTDYYAEYGTPQLTRCMPGMMCDSLARSVLLLFIAILYAQSTTLPTLPSQWEHHQVSTVTIPSHCSIIARQSSQLQSLNVISKLAVSHPSIIQSSVPSAFNQPGWSVGHAARWDRADI